MAKESDLFVISAVIIPIRKHILAYMRKCREGSSKFILLQTSLPCCNMECKHNINLADGERERERERGRRGWNV